jgi:putative transposase
MLGKESGMERFGSRNRRDAITSRFRLRDYDYSTPGLYFVTICAQDRLFRFGHVVNDVMVLNEPGVMLSDRWSEVTSAFADVTVEHHVVMPNHVHAIIGIGLEAPAAIDRTPLPDVLHWYKSMTTTLYIQGVKAMGWPRFNGRLWQKGYHDHIIRNERAFDRFWDYIDANPAQLERDAFFV